MVTAPSVAARCLGISMIATMGGSSKLNQVHTHGIWRLLFGDLGDLMRGFDAATNIDDDATHLYWRYDRGKGGYLRSST